MRDYPVGGLISEYCRLYPSEIKEIIYKCEGLDNDVTAENMASVLISFRKNLLEAFPPVMAVMISVDFLEFSKEMLMFIQDNKFEEFLERCLSFKEGAIKDFIFEGSPYTGCGYESALQFMLTVYNLFAGEYVTTKYMFNHIFPTEQESDAQEMVYNLCVDLFTTQADLQRIDYRLIYTSDQGMIPLYTIHTPMSLLLFEMANCLKKSTVFVKCKNCGQFFVPEGRSDTIYCTYVSPQNGNKTCREIGAQVVRANKEKNDIVTSTYRKTYKRIRMASKRHPHDKQKRELFEKLTTEIKTWRKNLKNGAATTEEFLEWISQF